MICDVKRAIFSLLILSLLAPAVLAHGGTYRGPRGITPGTRIPSDPPPPGTPRSPGPVTPPEQPGTPQLPPLTPGGQSGPITGPNRSPGSPATPGPTAPPRRAGGATSQGPGLSHWVYWWNLNRERILNLRELQAARLRERTTESSPHVLGEGGERNARNSAADDPRPAIVAALILAADDSNADVATGAILALGKTGDASAIPVLMRLVNRKSADPTIRESAALALGMLGRPEPGVRAFLTEIAGDRDRRWRTRAFAALGLGFLGDSGAVPSLMSLWRGKADGNEVPTSALLGLGLLGDEIVVPDLVRALSGRSDRRERDDRLRAHAAAALCMIRSRAAVPALMRALSDREVEVRRQSVLSIGAMAGPEDQAVIKLLLQVLLRDRDAQTRAFAAVSLGEIGSPTAADALLYAYRKDSSVVVPYAAFGLALLARNSKADGIAERIVPFLRGEFLERKNQDLRGALALAVGIAGDRPSVEPLRKLLRKSGAPTLRGHAAMALGLIGAVEAAPDLRSALTDGADPIVKREVALALGLLGDREATRILIDLVKNGKTEFVRGSAAAAVGRLADSATALTLMRILLDRENPDTTRAFVAVALGLAMDSHEVPLLSRIGEHFNHRMVLAAVAEILTFL